MEASSLKSLTETLQQQGLFSSVTPAMYEELVGHLRHCLQNSTALLHLEKRIKESASECVHLCLCAVFLTHTADPQLQWVASLLLKNTLKDNYAALSKEEADSIKRALFTVILHHVESGEAGPLLGSKKLQEEFYLVISGAVVKEFLIEIERSDTPETPLFDEVLNAYQRGYNYHLLRVINDVFEDGNDDRMWRYVPKVLPVTLHYMSQGIPENKLLFNAWILLQTTQWTIGVDQQALEACFTPQVVQQLLDYTLQHAYVKVTPLSAQYQTLQAGLTVEQIQLKRYSAKILTLLFRDFLNANSTLKNKFSKPNAKAVYALSLKNLLYHLPFYLHAMIFNQSRYSSESDFEEEEDFEIEFQSFVVQVISLMSTLISLYPKVILKEQKSLMPSLLLCLLMYSLKSPYETEKNYQSDQNLFLTEFLMDASVDYESNLSIRSSTIDFVDQFFEEDRGEALKQVLEQVIAMLATDRYLINGHLVPQGAQVLQALQAKQSIGEVDTEGADIYIPEGQLVVKQELAFFLFGSLHEYLSIQEAHVQQCLSLLTAETEHSKSLVLRLRALWLLEKLSANDSIGRRGSPLVMQTFQTVAELFAGCTDFVQNYQYLRTVHRYAKLVDLKGSYPDRYQQLVSLFMQKAAELIKQCNEETVHVPLESLTFLSKVDDECCARVCGQVMPGIIELYAQYHQDGLIGSDIVDLLKLWARIPKNEAFIKLFMEPHIATIVSQMYKSVMVVGGSSSDVQKLIDSSVFKNMLSILSSFLLQDDKSSLLLTQHTLTHILHMLLEILNASKETYVCLYLILPLSAFTTAMPSLVQACSEQTLILLRKILSLPGGLDESCLLYVGHWVLALADNGLLQGEGHQQVLLMLLARLARAKMPSTAKSFVLPIAAAIVQYGAKETMQFMGRHQLSEGDLKNGLSKWLVNFPNFNDGFSRELSRRALTMVLAYSSQEIEVAGMKLQPGTYSKEDVLIQVAILSLLASDLIYRPNEKDGGTGADNNPDADADFEDVYGEEEDYGDDQGGDALGDFGNDGMDDDMNDMEGDHHDEAALVKNFSHKIVVDSYDQKAALEKAIRGIGEGTIQKIISSQKESGSDHFSKAEKEAITKLFSSQ